MRRIKKTVLNKKPKESLSKLTTHSSQMMSRELWAILFFVSAIFVLICNQFPNTTGLIGKWLIIIVSKLVGENGLNYLPLFLTLPGLSFLITSIRRRVILSTITLTFVSFVVLLERLSQTLPVTTYPGSPSAYGGWVGDIGYLVLFKLLGEYGTMLVIVSVFLATAILMFGFSLKNAFLKSVKLIKRVSSILYTWPTASPKKRKKSVSLRKRFVHGLFYVNRHDEDSLPYDGLLDEPQRDAHPYQSQTDSFFEMPEIDTLVNEPSPINAEASTMIPVEPPSPSPLPQIASSSMQSYFQLPPVSLLVAGSKTTLPKLTTKQRQDQSKLLEDALLSFNVKASVINITVGPSVTRYELQPGEGVKISKITALSKDIALKLSAPDIRIEAPIPGKALVGIEVPNTSIEMVTMRHIMDMTDYYDQESKLLTIIGLTITGEAILMDLGKMPHVLIAGATGSGKSVCINTLILSILMRASPEEVKFLMIDPKKVELSLYEGIPHLLAPVVTNPHKAAATLKQWALLEMENRYEAFSDVGVKDIAGYSAYVEKKNKDLLKQKQKAQEKANAQNRDLTGGELQGYEPLKKYPYIVVIIDELADLMMVASQDVEQTICRLAQMARATGIHLVIATQRPSVNVVTGLIKANVPSRVSFFLQSQIDSRTILDVAGAEKLLGKGDMLYSPVGSFKPKRVQGVFVSESEVKNVVEWLKKQGSPDYVSEIIEVEPLVEDRASSKSSGGRDEKDELYEEAKQLVMSTQYASTSYLQRKLRIGYNRAARIMDQLEEGNVISEYVGEKKSRSVI